MDRDSPRCFKRISRDSLMDWKSVPNAIYSFLFSINSIQVSSGSVEEGDESKDRNPLLLLKLFCFLSWEKEREVRKK